MLVFHVSTMNISYFSPVKISDKLTRDSLSAVARKYAAGRLIDLGCGTRPYEEIFRPHIESYFGVDFEPTADRNYGGNTNADLYRDCADTRLPEASFDTLLSTQVIEHIYDTGKYLDECLRLLKPGGAGIFTAPLIWPCHSEPYDYYRFTRYSLEKIFRDRGFEIEELTASGFSIATAAQLAVMAILGNTRGVPVRLFRRLARVTLVPLINLAAVFLNRFQGEEALCLNYLIVVRKPRREPPAR